MRTLSRFALIGIIGGGVAACSSDASRLGDPFGNPFASNTAGEPSATGSLPDGSDMAPAPTVPTGRIQSHALGAPGVPMSPRPLASAAPMATGRVASTEPVSGMVSGMNPDAGRAAAQGMTTRAVPTAPPQKLQFNTGAKASEAKASEAKAADAKAAAAKREAEARAEAARQESVRQDAARKEADARKHTESRKVDDAKKLADAKKLVEANRLADAKKATETKKTAETRKTAKAEDKPAKDDKPAKKVAEAKVPETKAEVKPDPAKAKAEAARKAAETEAKLAKAEAAKESAKEAAKKVAEAKAAETAAKAAPVKVASLPEKVEPANTGSVAAPAAEPDQSFRWPAKGRVISGYGSSGNEGINISVPEGTAVKAAEDGTVAYAGSDVKGYGKLVLVRHTNGYVSAYAHNGELDVRPGEKVKRGQTIAKSGASGNVTSPQLHFEIRKGATPVDPMPHLASN